MAPEGIIESNWDKVVDNFDDMNLKEPLLRGIYAYGFEKPSAIQQRAILPCIEVIFPWRGVYHYQCNKYTCTIDMYICMYYHMVAYILT